MSQGIHFETPENVQLTYQPSGLGTRFMAWFLDNILVTIVTLVLVVGLLFLAAAFGTILDNWDPTSQGASDAEAFLYFAGIGVIAWTLGGLVYFGIAEALFGGRTVGKYLTDIRVVNVNGFSLDGVSVLLRTIFRVIDNMPPLWLVPFLSARSQRLGDMVAGTVVISDKPEEMSDLRELLLERPPSRVQFRFDNTMLNRARPTDFEAIEKVLERWSDIPEDQRESLLIKLVTPLARRLQTEVPAEKDRLQYLEDLLAAEVRRQHRKLG